MSEPDPTLETGILLIAEPMLKDPNFGRSVILLCEHQTEGSVGFVLNHVLPFRLAELLQGEGDAGTTPVLSGGPVQPDTLHVIHKRGDIVKDCVQVVPGVYWGGDFETIHAMLSLEDFDNNDFRFFLGYSGWGPGQLESEMERGGWIVSAATADLVFSDNGEHLWRDVLRRMGGEYAVLANFPDSPSLN